MKKLYKIENYGKDRQEWLKNRGFGGSSISALFGKSKYMNALDIFCSAINPIVDEKNDKDTTSTIYGKKAESLIAQLFALNFGSKYKVSYPKTIKMARRIDKPYMTYTADGLLREIVVDKRKGGLEIKTHLVLNKKDAEEWKSGNLPQNYVLQLLQGFAVMNDLQFFELYAILNYPNYSEKVNYKSELLHFHIEREDVLEEIKVVEERQTDFQENNIEKRIPPNVEIKVSETDKLIFHFMPLVNQYWLETNSDKSCEQVVDDFIGQLEINIPLFCEGDYKTLWNERVKINGLNREIAKLRKQTTKVIETLFENNYPLNTEATNSACKCLEKKLKSVSDEITQRLKAFKTEEEQ